jgi:hypothetical protein
MAIDCRDPERQDGVLSPSSLESLDAMAKFRQNKIVPGT